MSFGTKNMKKVNQYLVKTNNFLNCTDLTTFKTKTYLKEWRRPLAKVDFRFFLPLRNMSLLKMQMKAELFNFFRANSTTATQRMFVYLLISFCIDLLRNLLNLTSRLAEFASLELDRRIQQLGCNEVTSNIINRS